MRIGLPSGSVSMRYAGPVVDSSAAGAGANLTHHTQAAELLDALVSGVSAILENGFPARDY